MEEDSKLKWMLVDLNSFFASCEQQERPHLRGKPVAVVPMLADNTSVLAASYEAKRLGIKTGTKVFEAKKLCPEIQFVTGGHKKYVEYHHKIIEAIHSVCPVKKVLSIDEMACELIGREQNYENAVDIARRIKNKILSDVGECMTSSVGIGPNIMIAKIASDLQKPDGLIAIPKSQIPERLGPLDVSVISGVGRSMKAQLNQKGIYKISDILSKDPSEFKKIWGSIVGFRLAEELRGEDYGRAATQNASLSHEHVLPPNLRDITSAYKILIKLMFKACFRLRKQNKKATGLYIKMRMLNGEKLSKDFRFQASDDSFQMARLIQQEMRIWFSKENLKGKNKNSFKPIKVGMALMGMTEAQAQQTSFFDDPKKERIIQAMDVVNNRYGHNTLVSGSFLDILDEAKSKIAFSNIPGVDDEF